MIGLLFIILAQVFYAIGGLVIRKYLEGYNSIFANAVMVSMSALIFIPTLAIFYRSDLATLNTKNVWPFVLGALLWVTLAETIYVIGFQKAPSLTLASLMTLFYPLFSTILGIWFLNEALSIKTILAAILMIGGFVLLTV